MTVKRAVIYSRISKDRPDETSTTTQEQDARAYCARKGWTVVDAIEDAGQSAYSGKTRPGFHRALRLIRDGQADVMVVWRIDRFSRSIVGFWDHWRQIDDAGGELVSVTESWDTSTTVGRIVVSLIAGFAEMESDAKSARTARWHAYRRAEGMVPTGPRCYGYERTDDTLIIVDDEADVIRDIVDRIMAGDTLTAIARDLTDRELVTSKGKPWTRHAIRMLMRTPTIAGMLRSPDGGDPIEGSWTAIVDPDRWREVNDRLDDPQRRTTPGPERRWLLTGLVTCSTCLEPMRKMSRSLGRPPRYQCMTCARSVNVHETEEIIGAAIVELIDSDAWRQLRDARRAPRIDLSAVADEQNSVAEMYGRGEITLEQFRTINTGITARVAAAESEPANLPDVDDLAAAWPDLSADDRHLVATVVIDRVLVGPGRQGFNRFDPDRLSVDWRV
jgi:site-specific DNA recombinase